MMDKRLFQLGKDKVGLINVIDQELRLSTPKSYMSAFENLHRDARRHFRGVLLSNICFFIYYFLIGLSINLLSNENKHEVHSFIFIYLYIFILLFKVFTWINHFYNSQIVNNQSITINIVLIISRDYDLIVYGIFALIISREL